MINEIQGKVLLSKNKKPSCWFGCHYLFNIYRGCEHKCIYCDSRSLCYRIENFDDINIKVNAPELIEKELKSRRKKGTIGTGSLSDPYTFSEKKYKLTRRCLEIINKYNYPVHITTKSNLILRDTDLLSEINKIYASVAMTITCANDNTAKLVEPLAPSSSDRFKALGILSTLGITTSITMMPILPYIEDSAQNIIDIVNKADNAGVKYIVPYLGMTLRDRQRDYYYKKLDDSFPGIKNKYIKKYGDHYNCSVNNVKNLYYILQNQCKKYNIQLKMPMYEQKISAMQLNFLDNN